MGKTSSVGLLLAACAACVTVGRAALQKVGIVELHHHILVHLIQARREGVLPEGTGATLLSFDSHGDMSMPRHFSPRDIWAAEDPREILDYTQISDWVPAAMALGLMSRVVFVEPPWGMEFVVRPHESLVITVGTLKERGS